MILLMLLCGVALSRACLPDNERVECLHNLHSNQTQNIENCNSLGCEWCPSSGSAPWCYYLNVKTCHQPTVDCGYMGITKEGCENRGCIYQPNRKGEPWCCHTADSCSLDVRKRADCFPLSEGPNEHGCLARGCQWCPTKNAPWCYYDKDRYPPAPRAEERIDCNPRGDTLSSIDCITRGCQYSPTQTPNAPWCFFPKNQGYKMTNGGPKTTDKGYYVELKHNTSIRLFGPRIERVGLLVEFQTNDRLRLKFYDLTKSRFEVPLNIPSPPRAALHPQYDVKFSDEPVFSVKVVRRSTGTVLFDTGLGGLHLEDQFLQVTSRLPSSDVYGFGEQMHYDFRHDVTKWRSHGMFSRDQPPMDGANLYGVQPVYNVLEEDGNMHGVLFLNSAAQDATLTPAPGLIYRTIGGVLDIYLFLGPSPDNVIQQYTQAVGRPVMPPYWTLGFSLAKFGYGHINVMKENLDRMQHYQIPQDYQFLDIDYMDRNIDFTYSLGRYPDLPQFMRDRQRDGLKFIAILDPAIPNSIPNYRAFETGNQRAVWVNQSHSDTPVSGKVWPPGEVYYPDFSSQRTRDWWTEMCTEFHQTIPYDGLWIDMNEPANFYWGSSQGCSYNNINHPPYYPKIWGPHLFYKSLCPDHRHSAGLHYDLHSLYGWAQSPPTLKAARQATGKRSLVLSRSTFPGSGAWAVHWLGDNWSKWSSMKSSITGMFEFNMFGMPFVGADICGFIGDAEYEMCLRWQQVGSFYPFSRNHNLRYENRDQDPTVWGDDFARVARDTLHIRYSLLPYLYTLFHNAHINGTSVIRPLLNQFPEDRETRIIDRQFLWGSALLISPVLEKGATTVRAYFPDARWYSYYTGEEVSTRQGYQTLQAPLDFIPLHLRGGYIIPTQRPAINTKLSMVQPMSLIVMLDDEGRADGELFWDDGESIDTFEKGKYTSILFKSIKNELSSVIARDGFLGSRDLRLERVRILGIRDEVSNVTLTSSQPLNFTFTPNKELIVEDLSLPLTEAFKLRWF